MSSQRLAVVAPTSTFRRCSTKLPRPVLAAAPTSTSRRPRVPSAALHGSSAVSGGGYRSLVGLQKQGGRGAGVARVKSRRSGGCRRGTRGAPLTVNAVSLPNVIGLVAEVASGQVINAASSALVPPGAELAAAAAAASTAATASAATGGSFWGYMFSFLLGGAFFSTLLGVAALFISVGGENVRRALRVFRFLSSRVWSLVVQTAGAVKRSLQREGSTLKDTRKVLADGLLATQKEVEESLRAFNQERDFYAAAVGLPGLRTAQYVLDHMMPGLLAQKLESSLAGSISNMKHPNVKRMILKSVHAGKAAPLLTGARFYDVGEEAMAFDVDVEWKSDVRAKMDVVPAMGLPAGLARVSVDVHDIKFDGTVRVLLAGLTREDPGYGAIVVSFPDPPAIALDIRLGGGLEVTRVPWVRKVVSDAMKSWIKEEMLWPQRMLIPAERPPSASANGAKQKRPTFVLSDQELKAVLANDPLLKAEESLMSLKEIESSKVKNMKHDEEMTSGDVEVRSNAGDSGDDEFNIEISDPSTPKPVTRSAQAAVWDWLKGASKVTVDKTVEVSKMAVDSSVSFAQSQETQKVLKDVGSWWERDVNQTVGGWWNNVAARATGRKPNADTEFPPASWWTGDGPEEEASGSKDKGGEAAGAGADAVGAAKTATG